MGQSEMEVVGDDDVRVAEVEEHSYWEGVEHHDYVGVVEVELHQHYDGHHHEMAVVEVPSVSQLQVVGWLSQFHHAALQTRR